MGVFYILNKNIKKCLMHSRFEQILFNLYVLPLYAVNLFIIVNSSVSASAYSQKQTEEKIKGESNNLEWFVGFSEAESMFYVSNKGDLKFKIKLHKDDLETLYYIQNLLSKLVNRKVGVIVESKTYNEVYFSVDKFQDILEVIIPVFNYYLLTSFKFLDFIDFKSVANIKKKRL
uniref:Homing endonuclease LAGLIDADG domain-containing protein n=1 Tax=Dactylella sp. TaxID=1814903 RepID=A0A482DTN0_9PEZI|nr:hypothetical protein [Dactylella sp.]